MTDIEALPSKLYQRQAVRELDRYTIEELGVPGYELMSKAGRFAFHCIMKQWPHTTHMIILCGGGNNGGDGYIVASLAKKHGLKVELYTLSPPEKLRGDALTAYQEALSNNVLIQPFSRLSPEHRHSDECVIVDAMLGTGLVDDVKGDYLTAIKDCNQSGLPIAAIDIPSGLCADTGKVLGDAIEAEMTCTFIGNKVGLLTGQGSRYCGALRFDDLDVPAEAYSQVNESCTLLQLHRFASTLCPRKRSAHKGHFGHTVVIGGNNGFGGAIVLAAEASARMGAGLTSVATRTQHLNAILTRSPEVMVHPVEHGNHLLPLLERASVVVVGPGLGQDAWSEQMLHHALEQDIPTVLDADALNLVATGTYGDTIKKRTAPLVMTPHPGEAARLLGKTALEVESNRLQCAEQLSKKFSCHALLKGSGSLIHHPDGTMRLCAYGNPGMASGGMGDVLSGMLGGLIAQEFSIETAMDLAVTLHAKAADISAQESGERGLLASDLIPKARLELNRLCFAKP